MKNMVYRHITGEATDFIKGNDAVIYGWKDKEYISGYQRIKTVKVTAIYNGTVDSIWHFITIKSLINGNIGYIVDSWTNQLEAQVSKETGNKAFQLIIDKAKVMRNAKIKIEKF